ncbi:craniofacial development protein 2-like [Penaeus monodon]|uniref:craniofacial development protein 2-like n=1 Tax=Penaeus monodon TaxID=6687 RepID=UPI0018A75500|nr:craniofacial development protein 2-like [Penaeus monodon]
MERSKFIPNGNLEKLLEIDRMQYPMIRFVRSQMAQCWRLHEGPVKVLSASQDRKHGGALVLDQNFSKSVLSFWPKNDRMFLIKIKAILVVYAPTADAEDQQIDSVYSSLDELFPSCKSKEIIIVMGGFNAKVGSERDWKTVEPHEAPNNDTGRRFGAFIESIQAAASKTVQQKKRSSSHQAGKAKEKCDEVKNLSCNPKEIKDSRDQWPAILLLLKLHQNNRRPYSPRDRGCQCSSQLKIILQRIRRQLLPETPET